jgi:hypothetical protein
MRRATLLSILVIAGLLPDGCGNRALSDSELRTTATRICEVAMARADRAATPATPAAAAGFIRGGIDAFSPELSDLQTLAVSSTASPAYSAGLQALAAELISMRSALNALQTGADPLSTIKRLQRRLAPREARADLDWQSLGIPACRSR